MGVLPASPKLSYVHLTQPPNCSQAKAVYLFSPFFLLVSAKPGKQEKVY